MIGLAVDRDVWEYGIKEDVNLKDIIMQSAEEINEIIDIPYSSIRLRFGTIQPPFCRYNPKDNKLSIFLFPRFKDKFLNPKEIKNKARYILNHELLESSRNKPTKFNEFLQKQFSALAPDYGDLRTGYSNEALALQCKNLCSDIKVDTQLVSLNDSNKIGCLLAHDPNDNIDLFELKKEITPYKLTFATLSFARRAYLGRIIKNMRFNFKHYATKFTTRFHFFRTKWLPNENSRVKALDIHKELFKENPSWESVYASSKELYNGLS